jgi:hypothetical protein
VSTIGLAAALATPAGATEIILNGQLNVAPPQVAQFSLTNSAASGVTQATQSIGNSFTLNATNPSATFDLGSAQLNFSDQEAQNVVDTLTSVSTNALVPGLSVSASAIGNVVGGTTNPNQVGLPGSNVLQLGILQVNAPTDSGASGQLATNAITTIQVTGGTDAVPNVISSTAVGNAISLTVGGVNNTGDLGNPDGTGGLPVGPAGSNIFQLNAPSGAFAAGQAAFSELDAVSNLGLTGPLGGVQTTPPTSSSVFGTLNVSATAIGNAISLGANGFGVTGNTFQANIVLDTVTQLNVPAAGEGGAAGQAAETDIFNLSGAPTQTFTAFVPAHANLDNQPITPAVNASLSPASVTNSDLSFSTVAVGNTASFTAGVNDFVPGFVVISNALQVNHPDAGEGGIQGQIAATTLLNVTGIQNLGTSATPAETIAIGNAFSVTATGVSPGNFSGSGTNPGIIVGGADVNGVLGGEPALGLAQFNGNFFDPVFSIQSATTTIGDGVNPIQISGNAFITTAAIGNSASFTAGVPATTPGPNVPAIANGDLGVQAAQFNNDQQTASTTLLDVTGNPILSVGAPNALTVTSTPTGLAGLTISTDAIGNTLSGSATGALGATDNNGNVVSTFVLQLNGGLFNDGGQSASTSLSGVILNGTANTNSSLTTVAIGNTISLSGSAFAGVAVPTSELTTLAPQTFENNTVTTLQGNFVTQAATTNITGSVLGAATGVTATIGNAASITIH